jgi:putative aldouronate transport system permease protein
MRYKAIYLMVGIVLTWYFIFAYVPMFGLIISFQKFNFAKGFFRSDFVGLANFRKLFQDKYFRQAIKNTFAISGLRIVFQFPAPIIFALILNELRSRRYRSFVQTITYIPHFFSWIIMSGLVMLILAPDRGIVNLILIKSGHQQINFLVNVKWFRMIVITTDLLKEIGWNSIIYIAAIAGINPALYESAAIDGANRRQLIFNVTLPSIAPVISIMFILYVGNVFGQGFDQLYNLYNPLVFEKGDILSTYIIRTLQEQPNLGVQAAAGFINSLICFAFLILSNWFVRKSGQESIF